jgi:hypothetical protein
MRRLFAVLTIVLSIAGCGSETKPKTLSAAESRSLVNEAMSEATKGLPSTAEDGVVYLVLGSADSASITISTPTGQSQQDIDVPLMNQEGQRGLHFSGFSSGDFLYVSAQNTDDSPFSNIRCKIKVDGVVISDNESDAEYGIATCQGTMP